MTTITNYAQVKQRFDLHILIFHTLLAIVLLLYIHIYRGGSGGGQRGRPPTLDLWQKTGRSILNGHRPLLSPIIFAVQGEIGGGRRKSMAKRTVSQHNLILLVY